MADRSDLGGWLSGPGARRADSGTDSSPGQAFAGERLGRPATGPGSLASAGRRVVALIIDWLIALLIAKGVLGPLHWGQLAPLVALFVMNLALVGTAGNTFGHRLLGLRVERVDGTPPGPVKALIRSGLLCLAIPPLIWDADNRGLHDKLAGTLVARR